MAGGDGKIETVKICKHCKKKVVSAMECKNCEASYHRSCAAQANVINKDEIVECCEPCGTSEVRPPQIDKTMQKLLEMQFSKLKEDMEKSYKMEMTELKKSIDFMSECFEEQKTESIKTFKALKQVQEENETLKRRVVELEGRLNLREQKERENNIIISGVDKQQINTSEIVQKIFTTMKLSLSSQIIECGRINKQENAPILVKFVEKSKKIEVFKRRKEIRSLGTNDCELLGNKQIYFNDDLIPYYQKVLKKARDMKKNGVIKAAYSLSGKIFVLVSDGSSPKRVYNEEDLEALQQ